MWRSLVGASSFLAHLTRIPIFLAGRMHADWPKLLRLYSRLKPGTTVFEWMQEHDVRDMGIDVRRFTSFGVIKVILYLIIEFPLSPILCAGFPSSSPPLAHSPQGRSQKVQRRSITEPTLPRRSPTLHKPLRFATPPHAYARLTPWPSSRATSSIRRILRHSHSICQSNSSALRLDNVRKHGPSTAVPRTEEIQRNSVARTATHTEWWKRARTADAFNGLKVCFPFTARCPFSSCENSQSER